MFYKTSTCEHCRVPLSPKVFHFSTSNFGYALCMNHQEWFESLGPNTTDTSLDLFFALLARDVPATLEKFDGHKHIDIAVTNAKVNIEVDGVHHNKNARQALSDLQRTVYSMRKGYVTLRIPNSLVVENLEKAADLVVEFLKEYRRVGKR